MAERDKFRARNAPCPCGSGRKYKQCCLHKDDVAATRMDLRLPALVALGAAVGCVGIAFVAGADAGLAAGGIAVIAIGAWLVMRHPPTPKDGGDHPASINFGS